jgi:hypothetical protein
MSFSLLSLEGQDWSETKERGDRLGPWSPPSRKKKKKKKSTATTFLLFYGHAGGNKFKRIIFVLFLI